MDEIRADADAAEQFWARAADPGQAWARRVLADVDPAEQAAREVREWNARYSRTDTDARRRARQRQPGLLRDDRGLRQFVSPHTRAQMPQPLLGPRRLRVERAEDARLAAKWWARIRSLARSPESRDRRLARLRGQLEKPVARDWGALSEAAGRDLFGELLQSMPHRRRNSDRLYIPGQLHVVGMTPQRALEIAVAVAVQEERRRPAPSREPDPLAVSRRAVSR